MKKLAVAALFLFLVLNQSQAKMTSVERTFISHKRSVLMSQTVTRNVLVLATPRSRKRLSITNNSINDNDNPPGPDELDLHRAYRRPTLVKHRDFDCELSDYVQVRLAVARTRAMAQYQKIWS